MNPQDFVDSLNMAEMPRLGYELVIDQTGEWWCWPSYDQCNRASSDCGSVDARGEPIFDQNGRRVGVRSYEAAIAAQRKRLGRVLYTDRYPANAATRAKM